VKIAVKQQPLRELIAEGLAHHQKGDLAAAEQAYQRVLASEPAHADALHLLGVLRGRTDPEAGVRLVERAILANPRVSAYHNNLGNLLLRTGNLERAEQSYRQALRVDARNADAYLNLGNLLAAAGRDAEARECLQKALKLAPGLLEAHMSMGRLEERAGNWAAAEDSFRRVTQAAPRYAPAYLMLGGVSKARGQWAAAEEHLRRALAVDPGYADAYCNLGNLLRERDRLTEAAECYRQAIQLCPLQAADACNNLGVTLSTLGQHEEAVAALLRAVEIRPDYAEAYFNLAKEAILLDSNLDSNHVGFGLLARVLALDPDHAGAYLELGNLQQACYLLPEAVESYRCALARNVPNAADAWSNLGAVLADLARFDEAEAAFAESFALKPDSSSAWCNRGVLEEKRGLFEQAAAAYRRAAELDPSSFEARMNLASMLAQMGQEDGLTLLDGLVREQPNSAHVQWTRGFNLLLHGRYLEGWPGLEWRERVKALRMEPRSFAAPRWRGEPGDPLQGRTILLYAEQGFGDTLQFVRYAPLVAALGGRVILEVQPELQRLLQDIPGVSACVSRGQEALPEFDVQAPLMSLPYLLGATVETIPPPVASWMVVSGTIEPEQRPASPRGPLRVGLVWAGNPKHKRDHVRTISLSRWQALATVEGAAFVSLQVGPAEQEIQEHGSCFGFLERPPIRDFKDTAEILASLDLVITVDSAVAHLAGTMHMPVWILLDNTRDWRWGLAGSRTPWYPSARLFRQTQAADWSGPLEEVARALAAECAQRMAGATPAPGR